MKFRNQLTQRKGNRFSGSVPFLLPFAINFTAALAFYSLAPGDLLIRQQQSQLMIQRVLRGGAPRGTDQRDLRRECILANVGDGIRNDGKEELLRASKGLIADGRRGFWKDHGLGGDSDKGLKGKHP